MQHLGVEDKLLFYITVAKVNSVGIPRAESSERGEPGAAIAV